MNAAAVEVITSPQPAAVPDGAQSKVDTLSNQFSLMQRLIPRGGSVTESMKNLLAPPCLEEPEGSSQIRGSANHLFLGEALRRGALA
jgi:hypothetical protein